ncbi:xylulokinase [Bacteroidia bacterium]|nr:xylulokinase [Bacteroidia bacterium]GHU89104.1 xylulokinase [Bacteroidia bacterium]
MCYLGIDLGTSSICGVIYDRETKSVTSITKENTATIESSPYIWEKIQNPSLIMDTVMDIIREFTSKYTDIKGIGITGQMHGILYVDENGEALSPLYTWQDGRGNLLFEANKTYVEYLSEKSGYPLATGYGLVTHFYNTINSNIPCKTAKLCTIMDYAVMKLTGRKSPLTDYTNAASLGCFNLKDLCFDLQVIEKTGIDISILPETSESGVLAGYYSGKIPVYSAIGDNQASFLGSVKDIPHSIHITIGTSSQLSVYSKEYVKLELLDTRPFPGGGYILVGAALCGGQSLVILKEFFEQTLRFFETEPANTTGFFEKTASIPEDSFRQELPFSETCFYGTRSEPMKRGTITNISASNLTPENLIISFLNGISSELHAFYELIPDNIKTDKKILVGSGNSIKKNPLLVKAIERQFGYKLIFSDHAEEAALGACFCGIKQEDCS